MKIFYEIKKKEMEYRRATNMRGEVVCLDANTEARLAAHIVLLLTQNPCYSTAILSDMDVDDILDDGIRHAGIIIYGMTLKFDCHKFCIQSGGTGIPCFKCGRRSGIDCPGRQPGEATRCMTCLNEYIAEEIEFDRRIAHLKIAEQIMDENNELLRKLAE